MQLFNRGVTIGHAPAFDSPVEALREPVAAVVESLVFRLMDDAEHVAVNAAPVELIAGDTARLIVVKRDVQRRSDLGRILGTGVVRDHGDTRVDCVADCRFHRLGVGEGGGDGDRAVGYAAADGVGLRGAVGVDLVAHVDSEHAGGGDRRLGRQAPEQVFVTAVTNHAMQVVRRGQMRINQLDPVAPGDESASRLACLVDDVGSGHACGEECSEFPIFQQFGFQLDSEVVVVADLPALDFAAVG